MSKQNVTPLDDDLPSLNPFEDMENDLRTKESIEKARIAIQKSRMRLILDSSPQGVFFSLLAMRLECSPRLGIGTAATDGRRLLYEPEFINNLSRDEVTGVIVHEVLHCAFAHFARRGDRNPGKFNVAADLSLNDLIKDAGFKLPKDGCFAGEKPFEKLAKYLSAEEYYSLLPDKWNSGEGVAIIDPFGTGGVIDGGEGDAAKRREIEGDWKVAMEQAKQEAAKRGTIPDHLGKLISDLEESQVDWREVLRDFLTVPRPIRNDWNRPNRRFLSQGTYLPTMNGEAVGHIMVAIDTSGSVLHRAPAFLGEVQALLSNNPTRLTVLWCDAAVHRVDVYEDVCKEPLNCEAVGGGGTSHVPVFEWLEDQEEHPVDLAVCLTDLMTEFPDESRVQVPVLWVSTERGTAPFGETVLIK